MTDIDTRIAEILDSIAGNGFMVMVARDDLDWLISQIREQRSLCDRYREALEFYAVHGGERARAALTAVDGEGER